MEPFVFLLGLGGDAVEYCTSSKKDRLGEILGENVARPKVSIFCERIQDEERECKQAVLVSLAASLLSEERIE